MKPDTKLFMQRLVDVQAELYCFVAALMVSNKSDVSDVVQETNRVLIEHADDYDPSRPFTPWALTFARNQTLCHFKRCKRDRLVFDEQLVSRFAQEYARPDEEAHASPLARRLAFCLEKLSLRQRRLVALRYSEECRIDEIARQTGSRAAAVRAALFYIRKKLAECIASLCRTGREDFDMQGLSDFDALISDVIDGQAAPAELASLVPRLKESEECVAVYLAQMKVHALLSRRCLPGVCDLPAMVPAPAVRAGRQSWRYVLAAAAVALVVTGGWLAHQHQAGDGMPDLGRQSLAASKPVEVLFQSVACNLALPDRLPGTLRLGNGHIKARLASGVEMLLLGPAELNLVSAKEAKLVSGRIAIEVPPKTSGFTMYTRELEMWDIGTIFTVSAYEDGSDVFVLRGAVQVNEASGEPVDLCAAGEGVRAMAGETLPVKFVAESLEAHGLVAAAQERLASREPAETFELIDRVAEIWGEQYLPRLASTVSTIHGRMIVRKGFGRGAVAYARKKTKEEKMGIQKTVAGMAAATLLGAGAANGNVIDFRSAVRAEPDLIHHYTFESPREDDHLPRLKDWAGGVDLAETNRKTTAKVQYVEGFDTQCGAAGKAGFSPASYDTGAAWFMTNAVALPNTLTVECIVSFYTNSASVNTYIVAYRPTAEERGYFVRLTNGGQLQTLIGTSVNDAKTIVPEVAFDNWYYIANTYTVSGGKTTINCYYADLTGGGALQHVVVDAEANGHYGVSGQLSLGMLYGTWNSVCEYYSPCLIDEVAIYNTAQSFATIKKRFDTLKMPAPVLEYREIFPNDDSAARNFPQEGWQVYRTGSGTYYSASGCQIASSAVYTSFLEDLAAVASFPTRTGVTHGYVNINGIAADVDTPYFFWTDELTNRIDVGWLKLIKFDGNMRTNNYEGRVALRIDTGETPDHPADDVWYVSSDFNNPSGTGLFQFPQGSSSGSTHTAWKRYWLDVPGAEWAVLNFVPNTSMSVGDTKAVFPTNGLVTAVGIYHERHKHEQHGRYDNFTVYATRVYPPPPPSGTVITLQ